MKREIESDKKKTKLRITGDGKVEHADGSVITYSVRSTAALFRSIARVPRANTRVRGNNSKGEGDTSPPDNSIVRHFFFFLFYGCR